MSLRIFKELEFDAWAADNGVSDATLRVAAKEVDAGLVDARLGGYLIKKRMPAPGRGKSRSYRVIIAHRQSDRLVFLHGFSKSEQDNITKAERKALQALSSIYMQADDAKFIAMIAMGLILEIDIDE